MVNNDSDQNPQTEKTVIERDSASNVGVIVAIVVIGLLLLFAFFGSGMFDGVEVDAPTTNPTEVTPTPTPETSPAPNEGQ